MNPPPTVLLLYDPARKPADLDALVEALRARDARVDLRPCGEPYGEVLQALVAADTAVFWR